MIHMGGGVLSKLGGIPRESGDDPNRKRKFHLMDEYSPRERG